MKKRYILVLLLSFLIISQKGFAYDFESGGIYYNIGNNNTVSVTRGNTLYAGDISIPNEVSHDGVLYSVTSIGNSAFSGCSGLTSITIPNSVTSIGYFAFYGCIGLTSINIPNSVTSIGGYAFYGCSGLTSITIPNSVTSIGEAAFSGCSGMTSITIPNSVTSIGNYAFSGCSGLTSITIPNSVTSIGNYAFSGCSGLTSITIPNSVTSIGGYAFYGCSGMTSIVIPNSVMSIDDDAFSGCSGLTSINVSNGNSKYDSRNNCNAIIETSTNTLITGCRNTVIPNSVTSIGGYAFYGCSGLTSITIPNSVTSIGWWAFNGCIGLTSINVSNGNSKYDSRNNCNAIIETSTNTLITGCRNTVIPNSVTSIGNSAFSGCSGLTSITIPNSVTSIGDWAFYYCSGLTSITIPNSVTSIRNDAFYGCSGLTSITIPNSVTSIGSFAFAGCLSLIDVISQIQNPFEIEENVFSSETYTNAKLTVPLQTESEYRNTKYWNKFTNIVESSGGGTSIITVPGFVATGVGDIDLATAPDTLFVFFLSGELPEGSTLSRVRMIVYKEGAEGDVVTLTPITSDFRFLKSGLQSMVVGFFGPRPDQRTLVAQVLADVVIDGQAVLVDAGTFNVAITPKAPKIAPKYYLIGGPMDWYQSAASKSQVFEHSSQDVYTDPVFTYMMPGTGSEMWFAFGDEEACDASVAGDWSKLFGTKGDSKDLSGSFDYRYNLGGDHPFCVDGSATFYRISINMIEMTYEITPIVLASQYYMVGGLQGWSESKKTCLFTPEGNNIQSYTTKWTGAWDLKIWAADDFGNWDAAYGCPVDGDNSPSGTLTNSASGAISAPSAELYKFTIDMNSFTYTWTKLENQSPTEYTNISLIGEFNGWGGDFELEQVTPHNWYAIFTQEADSQLKFRANHDWSVNWGFGSDKDWNVTESTYKTGSNGAGNIFVPAGTYAVYFNDITNSMMFISANVTQSYTLSIIASGYGSAYYNSTSVRNTTKTFSVTEGSSPKITFTPDNGYRVASLYVNNNNVTSSISNNSFTINNIRQNTTVSVSFESIPETKYNLTISASGYGSAYYNSTSVRNTTKTFSVTEGSSPKITFTPDDGYRVASLYVNNNNVTSGISNNSYTIYNISQNTEVSVTFGEESQVSFIINNISYLGNPATLKAEVQGVDDGLLNVEIPLSVTNSGKTYTVNSIASGALSNRTFNYVSLPSTITSINSSTFYNTMLGALIWNASTSLSPSVFNYMAMLKLSNFLLYVKDKSYAPSSNVVKNIVVIGSTYKAENITLADGTNTMFYCPKEFTATNISYTHNYSMETGIGEAKGWETICLPFKVQKITHAEKGEITPFASYVANSNQRPFWLYKMGSNGFIKASAIEANTPYLISMPNNTAYDDDYILSGNITFFASNATVKASSSLNTSTHGDKTFAPTFAEVKKSSTVYPLNVNNGLASYSGVYEPGSRFISNLRNVYPFEAYMTSSSAGAPYLSIEFDDGTTGFEEILFNSHPSSFNAPCIKVYNLNGQLLFSVNQQDYSEKWNQLPSGVYIVNGRKTVKNKKDCL